MKNKKVTIREVARHAGVSVTTVSMVLSNNGKISENTTNKVNQSIKELGYIRNRSAANLRSKTNDVIGLIVNDIGDSYYSQIISGVIREIETNGCMIYLAECGHRREDFEKHIKAMSRQGVGGIVVCSSDHSVHSHEHLLVQNEIPTVYVSTHSIESNIDSVYPDNRYGAKIAAEYLIKQGHKSMAYLGGKSGSQSRAERVHGLGTTLKKHGLSMKPDWIMPRSTDSISLNVQRLLSSYPQLTALICDDAATTMSAIYGAYSAGRQIGNEQYIEKQISVVGFNCFEKSDVPISTVNVNAKEMGSLAAQYLIEKINSASHEPFTLLMQPMFSEANPKNKIVLDSKDC